MGRCWGIVRNLRRCGRMGEWKVFCHDHKRQWIIWISFLVFTVGGGTASIIGVYNRQQPAGKTRTNPEIDRRQLSETRTEAYGGTAQLARHFKNAGCNSLLELDSSSAIENFNKALKYDNNSHFVNWVIAYVEKHKATLLSSRKTESWLELYRQIIAKHGGELDSIIRTRFVEAVDTVSR